MLYIYFGNDGEIARKKAQILIQGVRDKAPEAEYIRLTDEERESVNLNELISTQGLFKSNYIVFFDTVGDIHKEWAEQDLQALTKSTHMFVLLTDKLDKASKTLLEKCANKVTECKLSAPSAKFTFDEFGIVSALKSKNKPKLWQGLTEARLNGQNGEALAGLLFWAVKDMYNKGSSVYTKTELKVLAIVLAKLPHDSRRNAVSIHNTLETFALKEVY